MTPASASDRALTTLSPRIPAQQSPESAGASELLGWSPHGG